ncbi:MAG TPA: chloride channel protein [bacterium]|nr:chloride channel protein [bacterium]
MSPAAPPPRSPLKYLGDGLSGLPWASDRNGLYIKAVQLAAAVLVGVLSYGYAGLISATQGFFLFAFHGHTWLAALAAPLVFLGSTWLVVRFAPEAHGSGIPQVLRIIEDSDRPRSVLNPLVSVKTAAFKALSTALGTLGGASIGREGPTVQIAASAFAFAAQKARLYFGLADFRSFLVAGAAAGIAAAFNTPLAGITFALEEIAEATFTQFKRVVMLSVIVAGITAQALGGNYLYFGHPLIPVLSSSILPFALVIGLAGGLGGGFFARVLTSPFNGLLPRRWWTRALACGVFCSALALLTHGVTTGSGYEATRHFMDDPDGRLSPLFFAEKFLATVFSYMSGMAGGIFSPCLSIGAGMGFTLAHLFHVPDLRACALIGMVAFFSGVVQTPLTAVIIITEMTDQSSLLIPFLIAAFVAHGVGKLIMPVPLYRTLANRAAALADPPSA